MAKIQPNLPTSSTKTICQASFIDSKEFHFMSTQEIQVAFEIGDFEKGLTQAQAQERLLANGPNKIKFSYYTLYAAMFRNLFNVFTCYMCFIVLLNIATIFFNRQNTSGETAAYATTSLFILITLTIQLGLELEQVRESIKSARQLETIADEDAFVLRDGEMHHIKSDQLVLGDVVMLGIGDKVSADLRLVNICNLRLDTSALTGSSEPIDTVVDLAQQDTKLAYLDANNMAFEKSVVMFGSGKGVVIATGKNTIKNRTFFSEKSKIHSRGLFVSRELNRLGKFTISISLVFVCLYLILWGVYLKRAYLYTFSDILFNVNKINYKNIPK
jgi:magnesium-transporting ATPase (P-type)